MPRLSRRTFLHAAGGTVLAGGTGMFAYTWRVEPHWVEVVRRAMPIARLPDSLLGARLVQISDLHIGTVVDDDYITSAVRSVAELDPDIIAITGDFLTTIRGEQVDHALRILKHLKPARLATIGIMGNHDYGCGWVVPAAADRLSRGLADLGVTVLRNEVVDVGGLQIAGMDDWWAGRFDPRATLAALDRERAAIALVHNPDAADQRGWDDYKGWILCGHTHGGQCKPPFFRPPLLPVANKRYVAGEIDLFDGRRMYINRGLGYLHRVRFNARPEITVFTLTRA